jgi:hypothetical protein
MRPLLFYYYDPFGVDEPLPADSWKIYPNPVTSGTLHIENMIMLSDELRGSGTRVQLFDMLGRSMKDVTFDNTIETGSLPQGFYILRIVNTSGSVNHTQKILIN